MKLANIVYLLTIGIALSLSSVGCKKGLDKTTTIPGHGIKPIADTQPTPRNGLPDGPGIAPPLNPSRDPGPGGATLPPVSPEGVAATDADFSTWNKDSEIFKDQTVYFDFDQHVVKASEIPKLEEVARRMKTEFASPNKALRIEGHCDERGTEEYNRALGDRRALSVREKLVQLGMDAKMIATITMGEENPVDPGHTDAAYKKNRRGQIILLTKPGSN